MPRLATQSKMFAHAPVVDSTRAAPIRRLPGLRRYARVLPVVIVRRLNMVCGRLALKASLQAPVCLPVKNYFTPISPSYQISQLIPAGGTCRLVIQTAPVTHHRITPRPTRGGCRQVDRIQPQWRELFAG